MPTDPAKAKSIFLQAVEKHQPAEWDAFLDEACVDSPDVRREVEVLLGAHAQAGVFLEQGAVVPAGTLDQPIIEKPGTQIGPYRMLQEIGQGGMGVVYMAEQTEPVRRKVALKIIKPGMDTRQVIARFEAERQALSLMDHPNIAKVLDAGTTSTGRPYFVMELVKGQPITEYCDQQHLTPRQRLELFLPVCQAIQHAHQKGIIHRDVKPSNVLVAEYDGRPVAKVIDFGVAKAVSQPLTEKTMFTGFGQVVGTLEYMSPEQARVNQLDVDTRSDIYSLGVLLYELLTGNTPFDKQRLRSAAWDEMLRIIREEEPPRPSTRLSESKDSLPSISAQRQTEPAKLTKLVRGELDWIVMKALEKDRNRRYETANGFASDILRYLNDEPVLACPPSAGYRLKKFASRHKGPVLAACLLALSLVGGVIGTTWGMFRAATAEREAKRESREKAAALVAKEAALTEKEAALIAAQANEQEAQRQETLAKESERVAKQQRLIADRRFYAGQINLAQQAWGDGQIPRVLELLESQRPKIDQDDLRGFEWYYLWRLCHQNVRQVLRGPAGQFIYTVAVTPDGKTLVTGSTDGVVRIWDVGTGKRRAALSGHTSLIWRLATSPDGKTVASGSGDTTVKLWNLETGDLLDTLAGRTQMVRSVAYSPDGKVLAVGTEDGALELWDTATRQRRFTLPAQSAPTIALAFSPDGQLIATGQGWNTDKGEGGVIVWDATANPPRMILRREHAVSVSFSPDSKLLATCINTTAKVWEVPSGELKATWNSSHNLESVAFSSDGKSVVLGGHDRTIKVWEIDTGARRTLGAHFGNIQAVVVVPQSDFVASAGNDGVVRVWHTGPLSDAASFAPGSAVRSLTFTPDNKSLVVGRDQSTEVLDAASGLRSATLPAGGVAAVFADVSLLAASEAGGKLQIWDVAAARPRFTLPVGPELNGAVFSRDNKALATWNGNPEPVLRIWDVATMQVRVTLKLERYGILASVALSPDGNTLASLHQFGWVNLWDAHTGEQRLAIQPYQDPTQGGGGIAFSHDGRRLAAGNSEGILRLWNVETGQLRASFKGHASGIASVAFSPDDRSLLSGSSDRTARLWDVATGQELCELKAHDSAVRHVGFSPDGKRIATASHNVVKLWIAGTEPEATRFRVDLDPDDPDSPRAANRWGDRLLEMNRLANAKAAYRQAQARLERLSTAIPDNADYRQELAYSLVGTALSSSLTGATPVADQDGRRRKDLYQALTADEKQSLAERLHVRGHELERLGRRQYAVTLFGESVDLIPGNRIWHLCRGRVHVDLENWQQAADDLALWTDSPAADAGARYTYALLCVQTGQKAHYQKTCLQMLEQFGQSAASDSAFWTIWTSVIAADAVTDWAPLVQLAETAVAQSPTQFDKVNLLGAVLYRAGRFTESARRLAEADTLAAGESALPRFVAFNWLFQAMTQHRLGNRADAVRWLHKATQSIDSATSENLDTRHRLNLRLWRREAEELLAS